MTNRPGGQSMLPAHVGTKRSTLAALHHDFARLRALEHPHIARLLELGCNGKQYYVRSEALDGEPLRSVLRHLLPERLEIREADDILRAIGSALSYAHEHDLAHGEVSAENVLVTTDIRFLLTNFLAARVRKGARPPQPSDDVRGLARLAAELYTGSPSAQALRGARYGDVPVARLNAIRAVLQAPSGDAGSVDEFLVAAGLAPANAGTRARPGHVTSAPPLPWHLALPIAAALTIGVSLGWYSAGWVAATEQAQQRGRDALRLVAEQPGAAEPDSAPMPSAAETELPRTLPAAAPDAIGDEPTDTPGVAGSQPTAAAPARSPATQSAVTRLAATASVVPAPGADPPVLSLGVTRISAREDHSAVAIEVVRSGDTRSEAAVGWWATPDTAHEDDDYAHIGRQTVTFPAGATVERLLIPIVNDAVRESDEVFTVHLEDGPHGGVAGPVTATRVTLYDDD